MCASAATEESQRAGAHALASAKCLPVPTSGDMGHRLPGSAHGALVGMRSRERKALRLYLSRPIIQLGPNLFAVKRRKGRDGKEHDPWLVRREGDLWSCGCPYFVERYECGHTDAVDKWLRDGPPASLFPEYDGPRPTYPQDWPKYKVAKLITRAAQKLMVRAIARQTFPRGSHT